MELGFIQYDEGAERKFAPFMVPNGTDVGLSGLSYPVIKSSRATVAQRWIDQVESTVGSPLPLSVEAKISDVALQLTVNSDSGSNFEGVSFSDVSLVPAHSRFHPVNDSLPQSERTGSHSEV